MSGPGDIRDHFAAKGNRWLVPEVTFRAPAEQRVVFAHAYGSTQSGISDEDATPRVAVISVRFSGVLCTGKAAR